MPIRARDDERVWPPNRSTDPRQPIDPTDPRPRFRSDLPPLPRELKPHGYQRGWQFGERLQGLGAVVLGLIGLAAAYAIYSGIVPAGLPWMGQPSGLALPIAVFSPMACLLPSLVVGGVGLLIVGLRQFLDP